MRGVSPSKATAIKRFMRAQERPVMELVLVLQDVEDPVNVGSAFRIADALGIQELVLTGISARPPHALITKVGRAKDRRVRWRHVDRVEEALDALGAAGYERCAVEITPDAEPYFARPYPRRTCLVVGHEDHGVTRRALERCDRRIFIPMYGKGASLNVHVALGIVAFHALHHGEGQAAERGGGAAEGPGPAPSEGAESEETP